jgi:hypothetical protein
MTTLVTGAFGGIGAWVCKRRLEAGGQTVAFVNARPAGRCGYDFFMPGMSFPVATSMTDPFSRLMR